MKKSILYTGTGDHGMTSLVGGRRIHKSEQQIEAYGTIDELNSFIGLLITEIEEDKDKKFLIYIQNKLFSIGAYLATDLKSTQLQHPKKITAESIQQLEKEIDKIDETLPKMKGFILPGGTHSAATAHVCRTICRRAEREIYRLASTVTIADSIFVFMNRLSDYLFVLARKEGLVDNRNEINWDNTCI